MIGHLRRRACEGALIAGGEAQAVVEEFLARDLGVAPSCAISSRTKPTGEAWLAMISACNSPSVNRCGSVEKS